MATILQSVALRFGGIASATGGYPGAVHHQKNNDALMAAQTLKQAFRTDVSAILAMARYRSGGAIDPVALYRASAYRDHKREERPAVAGRSSSGIV